MTLNRGARSRIAGIAGAFAVVYGTAVGYMAVQEPALVYVSAAARRPDRPVPTSEAHLPWDTVRVRDANGIPVFLLASRLQRAEHHPWVLYFHGNAGLVGSRGNVLRYRLLREAGFNVLAVEYRGYGASVAAGDPSEQGLYADADAAWAYLTATLRVRSDHIVLYGWSLGSGPATYLAALHKAAALVTEGAFTSLPDVGAERYPWIPVHLVMRNRFDNLRRAARLVSPWTVFHGRRDTDVPFSQGRALAAAAHGARFVPLSANHAEGVLADRATSLPILSDIARQCLGLAAQGR
ncbi:MAG TPA: alpha/beta fold hydrolase [Gemmatimonadaceae bacterium]|nr:alpha/beta fold hydrolase [Gemmatimonadaceae bacterium]